MSRVKRRKQVEIVPDAVSVSKNHCLYPLVFPATKKMENHQLTKRLSVEGVADYSNGKLNYAMGFGSASFNGEKLGILGKMDGQVLFGLLAALQLENRSRRKRGEEVETNEDNYTLRFKSMYELLTFLKIDTHSKFYYEGVAKALHKIKNTTLYFFDKYYDSRKKAFSQKTVSLSIFQELSCPEGGPVEIMLSKRWYDMHEAYFVIAELELHKKLSPIELNLWSYLAPFRENIHTNGLSLTRNLEDVCYKFGYAKAPKHDLRRKLTRALSQVNKIGACSYNIRFDKSHVVFYNEDSYELKKILS